MSWESVKLGELGEFRNGLNYSRENEGQGLKVISVKNFGALRVPNYEELDEINPDGVNTKDSRLEAGDIVFVRSNGNKDLIGRSMYIEDTMPDVSFSGFCIRFRNRSEQVRSKFLAYYFRSPLFRRTLSNLGGGTNINNLNQTVLKGFEIAAPSPQEQEDIVSTISSYDDLIEINCRRTALLEEVARLLYREWFVYFRFPGHEHVKIIDGVPKGWEQTTFGDLFDFPGGFAFKSSTYTDDGKFGVVTIKNVHDAKFVPECPYRVAEIPQKMKEKCRLATGDILLSLTGNVGRACVVFGENYLLNQRVAKICGKEGVSDQFAYWTFNNPDTQKQLENLAYGVAQLNLSPVNLSERPFVRPNQSLMDDFTETTKPIFEQLIKLNLCIQELTKARDLLLPRLMDGRLEI